ncbi:MAG: class I SAM-dependent methyltransferase [Candidatus Omnitrophota bacterium]|nr:class I SAM-dependent methyltransferase [Candidatus Omnitrophota bacterium]
MKNSKYYENDRKDIIALLPNEVKRVLNVGCGFGLMGKRLGEERGIEVVGIENQEEAAGIARANINKLIVGDVENLKLPFEKGYFDCLIYGEILEHLKDPWKVLNKHTYYLKKDGWCIASIPNIAHYSIIKGLLSNKWEYKPSGILDKTHLRFFTIEGIRKMFKDAGYTIEEEKKYIRASKSKKLLNKLLLGRINHLLIEQYLIKGRLS